MTWEEYLKLEKEAVYKFDQVKQLADAVRKNPETYKDREITLVVTK